MPAPRDDAEFRTLYESNRTRLHALMLRMAGPLEADDLLQVTFEKAAKNLASFRGDARASTWLYRIAVNVALDWLRSRREVAPSVPPPDEAPTPEQNVSHEQMNACIRNEIAKLPENLREVFMLHTLCGFDDEEIAHTLGISKANAKVRLHRARQAFRGIIAARCDFYRGELSCKPASPDCCATSAKP